MCVLCECAREVSAVGKISDCQPEVAEGPGSVLIPDLVEGFAMGDLLSPHRPWLGSLSRLDSDPDTCRKD